ncbi:MAG: hypothetical protein ACI31M_02145 [Bacilli bacterium]
MDNNLGTLIVKKKIQKELLNELCSKDVIDFCQCNNIMKKLDEDIIKLEDKLSIKENMINIVVKIPV